MVRGEEFVGPVDEDVEAVAQVDPRYEARTESVSAVLAATLISSWAGVTGSQGSASASVNPAFGPSSH